MKALKKTVVKIRNYAVYRRYARSAATAKEDFPLDPSAEFVVSMASHTGKILSVLRDVLCQLHLKGRGQHSPRTLPGQGVRVQSVGLRGRVRGLRLHPPRSPASLRIVAPGANPGFA